MPEVLLKPINEKTNIPQDGRLLDALLKSNCSVMMACGGEGICSTCHVYVEKGAESLTPMTKRERRTLSLITGALDNSRLSCQCRVQGDGVEVRLPEGLFVESFEDLESLIGKRTKVPVLHPFDGRILIQKNKIITRTSIMQLQDVDFDVSSISFE